MTPGFKRVRIHDETTLRAAAIALCRWATRDGAGVETTDERYKVVTEGRTLPNGRYSSCGDLCHWLLRCLGCRDESLVNRNDDGGTHPWMPGENLLRLAACIRFFRDLDDTPEPGDIVYVFRPHEHVCVVEEWTGVASTYDYGQPGGKRCSRPISGPPLKLKGSEVGWILDLSKVPLAETAIVPEDFDGGEPDEDPYEEDLDLAPA